MSTFLTIVKFLPEIIAFIKMLGKLVESGKNVLEVKALMRDYDAANKKANETKDTSALEDLFNGRGN